MSAAPLTIETFVDSSFGENCYVLSTPGDGSPIGWIIDPSFPPQTDDVLDYVARQGIKVERIIITHGHLDHIAGVDAIRATCPTARISLAKEEHAAFSSAEENLSAHVGMPMVLQSRADEDLSPAMELKLGSLSWRILDVAGHSPAGRALYCSQASVVFTGDALFAGSVGRTDFPQGDHERLLANIRRNLYTLPGETVAYPGHGPTTTIEIERKSNPFVTDAG